MDRELEEDLAEALEGIDPVELLLGDPDLFPVAQEIWRGVGDAGPSGGCRSPDWASSSGVSSCDSDLGRSTDSPDSAIEVGAKSKPKIQVRVECRVCMRRCRGHRHFGAVVCEGCRAFFSRSVKNDSHQSYICKSEPVKTCEDALMMSCQRCRYQRCLKVGMSITKHPNKKNDENGMMVKKLSKLWGSDKYSKEFIKMCKICLEPTSDMTLEEKMMLENATARHLKQSYVDMLTFLSRNMDIFRSSLEFYYERKPIPLKMQKFLDEYLQFVGAKAFFGDESSCLDRLKQRDRSRLIVSNYPIVMEFLNAYRIHKNIDIHHFMESFVDTVSKSATNNSFAKKVKEIYHDVVESRESSCPPDNPTYEMAFDTRGMGFNDAPEEAARHRLAAMKVASGGMNAKRDLDPTYLFLMVNILLYSTDFLEIDDRHEAERVQLMYAYLLKRYISVKDEPHGDALFRESMLIGSYARELREIKSNAIKKMHL